MGFQDFTAQISLRDPNNPEKYIGSNENWENAERAIIEAASEAGLKTVTELGEAAFYGPKLDFMVKDALGRSWQLGTIQVDYNLPERFNLTYTGADNKPYRPVMIHRALFGSIERFFALQQWHRLNPDKSFLHIESDNLVLPNFPWEKFKKVNSSIFYFFANNSYYKHSSVGWAGRLVETFKLT
jgi:hypothetical protein